MDLQNRWAIGGVFAVAAGALVGLAIWLSPNQLPPAGTEIAPAGADVSIGSQTTTTSAGSVTMSPDTEVGQPAANGAAATTKPGQKAPAQVQATDEPAPTTTTNVVTTGTAPGETLPPPPQESRPPTCATYGADGTTCISWG